MTRAAIIAAAVLAALLAFAPVASAQSAYQKAGSRMCRALSASQARRACLVLQQLTDSKASSWSAAESARATMAIARKAPATVRRAFTEAFLARERPYWQGHGWSHGAYARTGGRRRYPRWYDDNAQQIQIFVEAYHQSGDTALLIAAEGTWQFELTARWHKGDSPYHPGGIYQTTQRSMRSLDANSGAIVAAMNVYHTTHRALALRFAINDYAWTRKTLLNPGGVLYRSQIENDGSIVGSGSPNGDAMMAHAGQLLYGATRHPHYLHEGQATAAATLARYRLEDWCPVFSAMTLFHLLPVTATAQPALNSYGTWVAQHTSHGTFRPPEAYGSTWTPNLQSGAAFVLIRDDGK